MHKKKCIMILFLLFIPMILGFEFYGQTYNITKGNLTNTNVTIQVYNFSNMEGPPTPIAYFSTLSNSTGGFYLNVTLDHPELMYKPVLRHFNGPYVDFIGPSLPDFPSFDMQSLSPINFFLKGGVTVNFSAVGNLQLIMNGSPEHINTINTSYISGHNSIVGLEWNNATNRWVYVALATPNSVVYLNPDFSFNKSYNISPEMPNIVDIELVNQSYYLINYNQSTNKSQIRKYYDNGTTLVLNETYNLLEDYSNVYSFEYDYCTDAYLVLGIDTSNNTLLYKYYYNGTDLIFSESLNNNLMPGKLQRPNCNYWYNAEDSEDQPAIYGLSKVNNSFIELMEGYWEIPFKSVGIEDFPGYNNLGEGLYVVSLMNDSYKLTLYTDGTRSFSYMVKDTKLGYPIEEYFDFDNSIQEAVVYLPDDRNYSIMIYPDQSFPVSYNLNDITANNEFQTSQSNPARVNIIFNVSEEWVWVSGYAKYNGVAGFTDLKIIGLLIEPGNMVFTDHPLPYNMSSWRFEDNQSDYYDPVTGFYNITLPASAMGSKILMFATAENNSDYFGNFRNITLTYGQGDVSDFNFSLQPLGGSQSYINVEVAQRDGFDQAGINITTNMLRFNLTNGTDSPNSGHIELELDYTDVGGPQFTFMADLSQDSSGIFQLPLLIHDINRINIYTPDYAPKKKKKTASDLMNQPVQILLRPFRPGGINNESFSDLAMDMLRNTPECNVPYPPDPYCYLTPRENFTDFNPLKIVMSGAELSFRMTKISNRITVHYENVDMLASGPPDAAFDSNSSQGGSNNTIEEAWRFGSLGPEIYERILLGFPYSPTINPLTIKSYLGLLYDDNWNVVWNISVNESDPVPSEFQDFNSQWFNSTTGISCSYTDVNLSSNDCYIDTVNNMVWLRIPHFTGVGTVVGGGGYENASLITWDETDSNMPYSNQTKYLYDTVKFFANYTNETSGEPINSSFGNCSIEFGAAPVGPYQMQWNSTYLLYVYSRNFVNVGNYTWNVTCNATYFNEMIALDNVTISADETAPAVNYNSTNASTANVGETINISTNWTENSLIYANLTCELYVNGALADSTSSIGSWCNYNYTLTSGDYPLASIYVNATDTSNNTGKSAVITVTVSETGAPVINYNSTNSSLAIGATLVVQTNWSDLSLQNNNNLTVVLYNNADNSVLDNVTSTLAWAVNTYTIQSGDYPSLTVYANATDVHGNTGKSDLMTITITETGNPVIVYNATNASNVVAGDIIKIMTNWSDLSLQYYNLTCYLYADGSLIDTINSSGAVCNFNYTTSNSDYPSVLLQVNATDTYSNTGASSLLSVEVNETDTPVNNYLATNTTSLGVGEVISIVTNWTDVSLALYNLTCKLYIDSVLNQTQTSAGSWCNFTYRVKTADYPSFEFNVTATDNSGNTGASNKTTITVTENTPPVLVYNATDSSTVIAGNNVYIMTNWSDYSLQYYNLSCSLYADGTLAQTINSTGSWCNFTYTTSMSDFPSVVFQVNATDNSNNKASSGLMALTIIETTPPNVTNAVVSDNIVASSQNISINVTVVDNTGNISQVRIGNSSYVNMSLLTGDIYSVTTTPSALGCSEGLCSLRINATDGSGNANDTESINIKVDDTSPVINSITLSDNYVYTGQVVELVVNVSDQNLYSVTANLTTSTTLVNDSNLWKANLTMPSSSGVVIIRAIDSAGNINSSNISFTVDNTPPTLSITIPSSGTPYYRTSGEINISFTVSDLNISKVNVTIDNQYSNGTSINGSHTWRFTSLKPGLHIAVFNATDKAGNNASAVRKFIIQGPFNASQYKQALQTKLGSKVKKINLTKGAEDVSNNERLDINTTLSLSISLNLTETNASAELPSFIGLNASWQHTFAVEASESSAKASLVESKAGATVEHIVLFENFTNFLPENEFSLARIVFFSPLNYLDVYYINDDFGQEVYKLSLCSAVPTAVSTIAQACYKNSSTNVTLYLPHFSGGALVNDTAPPVINITSPLNGSTVSNSYFELNFSVIESNPATDTFCNYTVVQGGVRVRGDLDIDTGEMTSVNGSSKYIFSTTLHNISDGGYNITVGCMDENNLTDESVIEITVADTTDPTITSSSPSGVQSTTATSLNVQLSATTNEYTSCKYSVNNVSYASMNTSLGSFGLTHTKTIEYTADDLSEIYYVVCQDAAGRNCTEVKISYSVNVADSDGGGSSGSSSSSSSSTSGATIISSTASTSSDASVVMNWALVTANQTISFSPNSVAIAVDNIKFIMGAAKSLMKMTVSRVNKPAGPTLSNVYQYFEIKTEQFTSQEIIGDIEITFRVNKTWVEQNADGVNNVSLYRLGAGWNELYTEHLGVNGEFYEFMATTPGFSYFAVSADEKEIVSEQVNETNLEAEQVTGEVIQEPEKHEELKTVEETKTGLSKVIMYFVSFIILGAIMGVVAYMYLHKTQPKEPETDLQKLQQQHEEGQQRMLQQQAQEEKKDEQRFEPGTPDMPEQGVITGLDEFDDSALTEEEQISNLKQYIKDARKEGYTKNELWKILLDAGWPKEYIKRELGPIRTEKKKSKK